MKTIMPDGAGGVMLTEVSEPELFENAALCRMTHSLISAGTERGVIQRSDGWERSRLIRENVRLGYLGAGVVEEVRGSEINLRVGDRVAYYGHPHVSHSERVVVPKHLIQRIPDGLSSEEASFMGISAIAMHGFRMAQVGLGEVCLVAGLGIIGNLCIQQALLAGCRVVATDLNEDRLACLRSCVSESTDLICATADRAREAVMDISAGRGADAVLPCMTAPSSGPMTEAIHAVRAGGRIVVVGLFEITIPREEFFQREAEVTCSCAAGPGRYDPEYERMGVDYPPKFVRWTEGRNLEESLRLIAAGRLRVKPLLGNRWPIDKVSEAYRAVMEDSAALGHVLVWPE